MLRRVLVDHARARQTAKRGSGRVVVALNLTNRFAAGPEQNLDLVALDEALRQIFLSQYVHRTYTAYVLSQFKKIEQDLRTSSALRWKHVMHLIRPLLSGITVLVYRGRLLAIRRGEERWELAKRV